MLCAVGSPTPGAHHYQPVQIDAGLNWSIQQGNVDVFLYKFVIDKDHDLQHMIQYQSKWFLISSHVLWKICQISCSCAWKWCRNEVRGIWQMSQSDIWFRAALGPLCQITLSFDEAFRDKSPVNLKSGHRLSFNQHPEVAIVMTERLARYRPVLWLVIELFMLDDSSVLI